MNLVSLATICNALSLETDKQADLVTNKRERAFWLFVSDTFNKIADHSMTMEGSLSAERDGVVVDILDRFFSSGQCTTSIARDLCVTENFVETVVADPEKYMGVE